MDAEILADAGNVERQHLVEERRVGKARDHHPDEEGKGGEVEEMSRKERSGERRKEAERGQNRHLTCQKSHFQSLFMLGA